VQFGGDLGEQGFGQFAQVTILVHERDQRLREAAFARAQAQQVELVEQVLVQPERRGGARFPCVGIVAFAPGLPPGDVPGQVEIAAVGAAGVDGILPFGLGGTAAIARLPRVGYTQCGLGLGLGGLLVGALQQRVTLDGDAQFGFEFDARERQQADRLLQLWRQPQLLA
jgi:hypothetical protein